MTTMSFPFEITPAGKVAESDGDEALLQQVRFVLSTTLGSRVMRPNFGSEAASQLFEPMGDEPVAPTDSISTAVQRHVVGVEVIRVDAVSDPDTGTSEYEVFIQPEPHLGRFDIEVRDIDSRDDWRERYDVQVPVVEFDGEVVCRYRLDRPSIEALLAKLGGTGGGQ